MSSKYLEGMSRTAVICCIDETKSNLSSGNMQSSWSFIGKTGKTAAEINVNGPFIYLKHETL